MACTYLIEPELDADDYVKFCLDNGLVLLLHCRFLKKVRFPPMLASAALYRLNGPEGVRVIASS